MLDSIVDLFSSFHLVTIDDPTRSMTGVMCNPSICFACVQVTLDSKHVFRSRHCFSVDCVRPGHLAYVVISHKSPGQPPTVPTQPWWNIWGVLAVLLKGQTSLHFISKVCTAWTTSNPPSGKMGHTLNWLSIKSFTIFVCSLLSIQWCNKSYCYSCMQ